MLLEIEDVGLAELEGEQLWGRHIGRPQVGSHSDAKALDIVGWVLGRSAPAVAVEVLHAGVVIRRVRVGEHRPGMAAAFPHVPAAAQSGFRATVNLLGTTAEIELVVQAVLQDQRRVPIGRIRARRCWPKQPDGADVPLVSVVIPCYKQAHFLSEAIESVLQQTYPHVEIVVVDDGSPDNTAAVAARYPGVRYIRQENQGLAAARNTGMRHSNGSYLVFLDADDRLLAQALETGLAALNSHPECAFVAGHCRFIAATGAPLPTPHPPHIEQEHYAELLRKNYIWMPGVVMYRRAVFQSVSGFDQAVDACADYALYLQIARDFPIYCHDTVVAEYRQHGTNMTRNAGLMLSAAVDVLRCHWQYVQDKPHYVEAYKSGMAFWQALYGQPLLEEVRGQLAEHQWQRALPGLWVLLGYYPRGLAALAVDSAKAWAGFDAIEDRMQALVNEQAVLQRQVTELQEAKQHLRQQHAAAQREIASLWQAVKEQSELERHPRAIVQSREVAQSEVAELRQAVQEQAAYLDKLASQIEALSSREIELQRRNQALADERDVARREGIELRRVVQEQAERLDALVSQLDALYSRSYQQLIQHIRERVRNLLPPGATVMVVSKGDDQLLQLADHQGWHFPQTEQGVYAGCYPADSAEAIAHLEALRAKGGEFLVFPEPAFWWLEHYHEFKQHLESHYRLVDHQEDAYMIFALTEQAAHAAEQQDLGDNVLPASNGFSGNLQTKSRHQRVDR